ncbi:Hypothetical predicted protein [Marmota monax]|uniref:Uncharacterized protein n=1 Tax=Marmota monax TaxID=9995 RepID=A0A5E4BES9_MARMO|nr:Hypothetical predicted protein [Marmota monax]
MTVLPVYLETFPHNRKQNAVAAHKHIIHHVTNNQDAQDAGSLMGESRPPCLTSLPTYLGLSSALHGAKACAGAFSPWCSIVSLCVLCFLATLMTWERVSQGSVNNLISFSLTLPDPSSRLHCHQFLCGIIVAGLLCPWAAAALFLDL